MPYTGVGLAINVTELAYTKNKLNQLSRNGGSKRKLVSMFSFRNAGVQALEGLLIKGTVSTLFLGSEIDTFLDTAHKSVEAFSISGAENIEAAQEFRKEMVQLHPFAETIELASSLPDAYKDHIGLESRFESFNMNGDMEIGWGDPVTSGEILTVGASTAASDVVVKNVMEMPLDNGAKKLTDHEKKGTRVRLTRSCMNVDPFTHFESTWDCNQRDRELDPGKRDYC